MMRVRVGRLCSLACLLAAAAAPAVSAIACAGDPDTAVVVPDASAPLDATPTATATVTATATTTASPNDAATTPDHDAACNPIAEAHTVLPGNHVDEGTALAYPTNPPTSGTHYRGVWANFQEFSQPVADGYLVHSMEHGAIVLMYKPAACATADCSAVLSSLRAIRDAVPTDPQCAANERVRVIIAPRPALDVPVAAAAWGFAWRAQCVDTPTLTAFITEHYAKAPEDFCAAGAATFP